MSPRRSPGPPGSIEALIENLAASPTQPVLIIDERRFGRDHGFEDERILFAGVLTTVREMFAFGVAVEAIRKDLDEQKRRRALKSADVLRGRLSSQLRAAVHAPLSTATVSFWAVSQRYLGEELRVRHKPAAMLADGSPVNGPETPIVEMISGLVAQSAPQVLAAGRLEIFVDRSRQNGLGRDSPNEFTVYDVFGDAPATQAGKSILLGAGVKRRVWAVCETTPLWGDWLLLADLAAHLWGKSASAIERLGDPRLLGAANAIGTAPGHIILEELALTQN